MEVALKLILVSPETQILAPHLCQSQHRRAAQNHRRQIPRQHLPL
eukprot:COSAG02_NODE_43825_length_371_cov_0.944853_1_plen_44_part_10